MKCLVYRWFYLLLIKCRKYFSVLFKDRFYMIEVSGMIRVIFFLIWFLIKIVLRSIIFDWKKNSVCYVLVILFYYSCVYIEGLCVI